MGRLSTRRFAYSFRWNVSIAGNPFLFPFPRRNDMKTNGNDVIYWPYRFCFSAWRRCCCCFAFPVDWLVVSRRGSCLFTVPHSQVKTMKWPKKKTAKTNQSKKRKRTETGSGAALSYRPVICHRLSTAWRKMDLFFSFILFFGKKNEIRIDRTEEKGKTKQGNQEHSVSNPSVHLAPSVGCRPTAHFVEN